MVTLSDESHLRTHVRSTLGIKFMLEEHMRGNDAMLLLTTSLTGIDRTESIVGVHVAQFREDGLFGCLPMLAVDCSRYGDIVRRYIVIFIKFACFSGFGRRINYRW